MTEPNITATPPAPQQGDYDAGYAKGMEQGMRIYHATGNLLDSGYAAGYALGIVEGVLRQRSLTLRGISGNGKP